MLLSSLETLPTWPALLALPAGLLLLALYRLYLHPLSTIPGPLIARLTDFHRFYHTWMRQPHLLHQTLHARHGPLVRLGPNTVSVSDPRALSIIYAHNSGFHKSDFYKIQQTLSRGRPLFTLFTSTDEAFHARLRRAVSNAYAMSTLVQFEPYIDSTTLAFLDQMGRRLGNEAEVLVDIGVWLQWYAFDVVGELTFSKRLGFLDRGEDVEGIIASIEGMLDYAAVIGQMPWLDRVLLKNPIRLAMSRLGLINANTFMVNFPRKRLEERIDAKTGTFKEPEQLDAHVRNDFLSRFVQANCKDPEFITSDRVLALTVANIFAGSDTTAISLRAALYLLCKHPEVMKTPVEELLEHKQRGGFARIDGLVDWHEAQKLPYLDAVFKEALRCHPAVGLPLERVTPAAGTTICGQFIPGGTIIGCSAWVIHQDVQIYGERPEEFRPSRWLQASPDQRKRMESSLFAFGAGSRTCIGKNISLLEMYKFVPALLLAFEISLPDETWEWKLHNAWFVKQNNFLLKLRRRTE